jgi:hypothetical protein
VFDDVGWVVDRVSSGGTYAADVLLVMDAERAVGFLSEPSRFRAGHTEIASVTKALAEHRVVLPPDRVAALLDELKGTGMREARPDTTAIGYTLQLLALSGHPGAREEVERAMKSKDEYLRGLASDAAKVLDDVPDAFHVALDAWSAARNVVNVPEPVRHYVAVQIMRNDVANGSFDQYLFNSYGEDIRHALAGLEGLGAKRSAEIVREVISLFGKEGPSTDRVRRQEQLDRVDGSALVRLSDEFLKDPDHLDVLLTRFAARHKELFSRGS